MSIEISLDIDNGVDSLKLNIANDPEDCRLLLTTLWSEMTRHKETGVNEVRENESQIFIEPGNFKVAIRAFRLMADLIERANENE